MNHYALEARRPNSEVFNGSTFGVLVMSRRPGRIIDEIAIDIPDRDEPLKRRLHPKVNDYVNRLMDRLDIGTVAA